jgi:hypothetical protein
MLRKRASLKQAQRMATDPIYRARANDAIYRRKYGITLAQKIAIFLAQGNACAICRRNDKHERLSLWHIDHSHLSNQVRGVLCRSCNLMLGKAADDPTILRAAANYLESRNPAVDLLTTKEDLYGR